MNEAERQHLLARIYNSVLLPNRSSINYSLVNPTAAAGISDQAPAAEKQSTLSVLASSGAKPHVTINGPVQCMVPSNQSQASGSTTHHQTQAAKTSNAKNFDLTIRVVNPKKKKDVKAYIITVPISSIATMLQLKEIILEQLGKKVVRFDLDFDVGYMSSGSTRICFKENDDMKVELSKIVTKGHTLWCDGVCQLASHIASTSKPIILDSNSESDEDIDRPSEKKAKTQGKAERRKSAEIEKKEEINRITSELKSKHNSDYNMVQYKFWAETLYNKTHDSYDEPPRGLIWGGRGRARVTSEKVKGVSDMATAIATALKASKAEDCVRPATSADKVSEAISPAHKIELQEKLLKQIELLHRMCASGAVTEEQFQARRESILKQLDELDQ